MGPNTLPIQGLTVSQKPRFSEVSVETCGYYKFWNFLLHVLCALSIYNVKNKAKLMKEYNQGLGQTLGLAFPIQPNRMDL